MWNKKVHLKITGQHVVIGSMYFTVMVEMT